MDFDAVSLPAQYQSPGEVPTLSYKVEVQVEVVEIRGSVAPKLKVIVGRPPTLHGRHEEGDV